MWKIIFFNIYLSTAGSKSPGRHFEEVVCYPCEVILHGLGHEATVLVTTKMLEHRLEGQTKPI